jgi:hypothetical protein
MQAFGVELGPLSQAMMALGRLFLTLTTSFQTELLGVIHSTFPLEMPIILKRLKEPLNYWQQACLFFKII